MSNINNFNKSNLKGSNSFCWKMGAFTITDNFLQFMDYKIELETLLILLIGLFLYLEGNNDLILFIILILLILS